MTIEVQIDAISGPTHHFGGLSFGNVASVESKATLAYPKKAALEGLEKMKLVSECGVVQLVLPPHRRPHIETLERLGFCGSEQEVIEKAYREAPELLLRCSSSSWMWMANAATVTPSCDSLDKKVHFTPANLVSNVHRSLEVEYTAKMLECVFPDPQFFTHHKPLPSALDYADEGAANHIRFSDAEGKNGVHLFVHGERGKTKKYPARQTGAAQEAICRLHKLPEDRVLFFEQNPQVIDHGVFHNDVISTGHKNIFLYHEEAFCEMDLCIERLCEKVNGLVLLKVMSKDLTIQEAVGTYFFNSQIISGHGGIVLICPEECSKNKKVQALIERFEIFERVVYVPLYESMKNGGGPACLRLRVPLVEKECAKIHPGVIFNETLYQQLKASITTHYPETFHLEDLLDPAFRKKADEAVRDLQLKILCD